MSFIASAGGCHVRRVSSGDGCWDASQHLDEIQGYVQEFDTSRQGRDLMALDLFAGEGKFEAVCKEKGMPVAGVELKRDGVRQNLLLQAGFYCTLHLILRLAPLLHSAFVKFWA